MRYVLLFLLSMNVFAGSEEIKILRVVDADTFIVSAPFLPDPLKKEMPMRLSNVDTPGVKRWANCDKENKLGEKATEYVSGLIQKAKVQKIRLVGIDKYGRLLGFVNLDGKDLSEQILGAKLGRTYYGGKKLSWCN